MATVIGKEPNLIRRTTCRECASIIEYVKSETTTRWVSDYGGGSEQIRELKCPACPNVIQVSFY